jgi:hypothetical protein
MDAEDGGWQHRDMAEVTPFPRVGTVFFDTRADGRTLRLSWHEASGTFVLSIWHHDTCTASFRLDSSEAPRLLYAVSSALASGEIPPVTQAIG